MRKSRFQLFSFLLFSLILLLQFVPLLSAQEEEDQEKEITKTERIQVTASRIPEAVEPEPASITIVTGDQLRATGANDLPSALSLVSGVSIAPGGDGGPASSVPELWGLREFDAFLLVVDSVPWGGVFNPALSTLDLNDVERIEIQRGAAPVLYGATSFVGVIHVLHRSADSPGHSARAYAGNYSTFGGAGRSPLPEFNNWKHALSFNFDSVGYRDDRTNFDRGHFLYRGLTKIGEGTFHLDADFNFLRQEPASPHPRTGPVLSPLVPVDANHNPSDAQQDENRYHFAGNYELTVHGAPWSTLVAFTRADRDITKGFLAEVSPSGPLAANGFRQDAAEIDLYFDSHLSIVPKENVHFIVGVDHLFGKGEADSELFDYFVNLEGTNPASSLGQTVEERTRLEDERNFFGAYGQMEWNPTNRWLMQAGLRLNNTHESREGEASGDEPDQEEEEGGKDSQTNTRLSGAVGVSFRAYSTASDSIWVFADYRNTFKPAAIDFGPEAEGEILKPETANSYEAGVKGNTFRGKLDWEVSIFRMDFENLVTSDIRNGLPVLINAGEERFTGAEFEAEYQAYPDLRLQFAYSHHNAEFRDFVQLFDGVPTQLSGNRLEMSPENLAAVGVVYAPRTGLNGSFLLNYVGDRYLNKRNTALADPFTILALGVGYSFGKHGVRFDIENVTDERDPVAESELGDAQYYLQPARNFRVSWQTSF